MKKVEQSVMNYNYLQLNYLKKVHGSIILHYTVCIETNTILLTNIPSKVDNGNRTELPPYVGVIISSSNPEKLKKVSLLNMALKEEKDKKK